MVMAVATAGAAALGDGDGELAAGEEAGLLAADGDEVGLGEDAEQVVLPQGVEESDQCGVAKLSLTEEGEAGIGLRHTQEVRAVLGDQAEAWG